MAELDQKTIENGFPDQILDDLIIMMEMEYQREVEKRSPGKNWLDDDPRYHVYKAVDELFQGRGQTHKYDYNQFLRHFAKCVLHMMMASEIIKLDDAWQK